jgi:NADH-quinone oxidoreductase subunit G
MKNEIKIDDKIYDIRSVEKDLLIFQFCGKRGKELPCFCYNEVLDIAGNCRVCLVEIIGNPKLVLACSQKIAAGNDIKTNSLRVQRARRAVLELLLINHPLDCPVCDQGGECDLQEIYKGYSKNKGRYYEIEKRSVLKKEVNWIIKAEMTRCIHCTRCIRFYKDIIGLDSFAIVGRGEDSEIIMQKNLIHVLAGNVVDLCPVGALTSKPYAFVARN